MSRLVQAAVVIATGAVTGASAQFALPPEALHADLEGGVVAGGRSFDTWAEYVASPLFEAHGVYCGTPAPTRDVVDLRDAGDCALFSNNPLPHYGPIGGRLRIPVVVHIIQSTTGEGFIPESRVHEQIAILNEDFLALPGTNGANGNDASIEFYLATVDPGGNPTSGITYSTNDTWFNDNGDYWTTLAWDTDHYMNVYTNTAGFATGYVPGFPQQTGLVGEAFDRIVIQYDAFGIDPLADPRRGFGRSLTHEAGHYFGLFHIFDGCTTDETCSTAGDLICDTPAQSSIVFDCASLNTCGVPDDVQDYMGYAPDLCMEHFTIEQVRRMRCTLQEYRYLLYETADGCTDSAECDDGDPCNGVEFCVNGICNSGSMTDCNGNGIDDACDAANGMDCNGNGVPDSCDTDGAFIDVFSGLLRPIGFGESRTFTMPDAAPADTDVSLVFNVKGDFDAFDESVDVSINGEYAGTLYQSGALCFSFGDIETLVIPRDTWNAAVAAGAGAVAIHAEPSATVNANECAGSFISVRVRYYPWVASRDYNGDRVPDECQNMCSAADLTTIGPGAGEPGYGTPDGRITAADLLFYVNAWIAGDELIADRTTTGAPAGSPGYGTPDHGVTADDIGYCVNLWVAGCP